jgi:hypothetical protein
MGASLRCVLAVDKTVIVFTVLQSVRDGNLDILPLRWIMG